MSAAKLPDLPGSRRVLKVWIGENHQCTVGISGVTEIRYHSPCGEGDRHFVDVYYDAGHSERWLSIQGVSFEKEPVDER